MGVLPAFIKAVLILAANLLIGLGTVETKADDLSDIANLAKFLGTVEANNAFNHENARIVAHKVLDRGGSNDDIVSGIYEQLVEDEKHKKAFFVAVYDQVWGYHEHTISYVSSRTVMEYRYQGKNYVIYGKTNCGLNDDECVDSTPDEENNYYDSDGFQKVLDKLYSGPDGSKKIVEAAEKYFEPRPPMILVVKTGNGFTQKYDRAAGSIQEVIFDGNYYVLVIGYE